MSSSNAEFQLLSAVRYDPSKPWPSLLSSTVAEASDRDSPVLLVSYHRDRLARAGEAFGWSAAVERLKSPRISEDIVSLAEEAIRKEEGGQAASKSYKIRPIVHPDGTLEVNVAPVPARPFDILLASSLSPSQIPAFLTSLPPPYGNPLVVILDREPTPQTPFTSHKTTHRNPYSAARERLSIDSRPQPTEVLLYNEKGEITEGSLRNVAVWRDGGWVTPPSASGGIRGTVQRWMMEQGRVKERVIRTDELEKGEWVLLSNAVEGCSIGRFEIE